MTLEVLFARQGQSRAFLQLCCLGMAAGMLLHLSVGVHRRSRLLGAVLDVLGCLLMAAAAALVLMRSGIGIRLYGVLGLVIGILLYVAGMMQVLRLAARLIHRKSDAAPKRP